MTSTLPRMYNNSSPTLSHAKAGDGTEDKTTAIIGNRESSVPCAHRPGHSLIRNIFWVLARTQP